MPAVAPAHDHRIARGIALRVASAGCFSVMSALLKLAATRGVVAPELLFYRAAFGVPVVFVWVWATQDLHGLTTQRPLAHLGRSALGISANIFIFQALVMLPIADATTISFTAPVFATILSWLILHEQVGRHRWFAALLGFSGVLIVMRPGGTSHAVPAAGVLVGLIAALGTSAVTITLRQLRRTEHVGAIVFWFFVGSALVGLALLPIFGRAHDMTTFLLLAGGGLVGAFAQIAMTGSLQAAPVSVLTPFDYLQLLGAMSLGWLLFATTPTINTLAGAALIAASGLYTAHREYVLHRLRAIPATERLT